MASEMYGPEIAVTWIMPEMGHITVTTPSQEPAQRRQRPARRFPPEVLTDSEVAALMSACGDDGPASARNRALIAILYRAGLRIGEALALYPKDIDLDAGSIRILHGKGDRHRLCGVDPGVSAFVRFWHAYRRFWPINDRQPLFCTREGKALSSGYVRRLLPALARIANVHKRVHAHGLRHTHARSSAKRVSTWASVRIGKPCLRIVRVKGDSDRKIKTRVIRGERPTSCVEIVVQPIFFRVKSKRRLCPVKLRMRGVGHINPATIDAEVLKRDTNIVRREV